MVDGLRRGIGDLTVGVTVDGVTESSMVFPESRDSISYERVSFFKSSIRASTETNSLLFRDGMEPNISTHPENIDHRPRRKASQTPLIFTRSC